MKKHLLVVASCVVCLVAGIAFGFAMGRRDTPSIKPSLRQEIAAALRSAIKTDDWTTGWKDAASNWDIGGSFNSLETVDGPMLDHLDHFSGTVIGRITGGFDYRKKDSANWCMLTFKDGQLIGGVGRMSSSIYFPVSYAAFRSGIMTYAVTTGDNGPLRAVEYREDGTRKWDTLWSLPAKESTYLAASQDDILRLFSPNGFNRNAEIGVRMDTCYDISAGIGYEVGVATDGRGMIKGIGVAKANRPVKTVYVLTNGTLNSVVMEPLASSPTTAPKSGGTSTQP